MKRQVKPNQKPELQAGEPMSEDPKEFLKDVVGRLNTNLNDAKQKELYHYGTPRHSGRYPWGSGENPYQGDMDFKAHVASLKQKGWTQKEIAKSMNMNTSQLRAKIDIASENISRGRDAMIFKLRDKGYSKMAIARQMQIPESTVRNVLKNVDKIKASSTRSVAEDLKKAVKEQKYIDVGHGCEVQMGSISKDKLRHAIALLEQEGYEIQYHEQPQMGTGKSTMMKILVPKGTPWSEVEKARKNAEIDYPGFHYEHGDYDNPHKLETPTPVHPSRVKIVSPKEGGQLKDGLIEIRPGCEDLNLGRNSYAQVRIAVGEGKEGTHYAKGVAVYGDPKDFPPGVDILVNSSKPDDWPMMGKKDATHLKPMKYDPYTNNPFGASINQDDQGETKHPLRYFQAHYIGKDGKEHLSALNIVNEQGTWDEWNRTLSSQFLAKQTLPLAKRQLALDARMRQDDFEELKQITNSVVKKNLLESFADNCDSAAVHLKAAALPRQATQLLIPFTNIKEDEIYAPNFRDGEKVCLIRFPHTGRFEIPELTVNNRFPDGQRIIGGADPTVKRDAVGINPKVAQLLSGADFDGDTVLVIPNDDNMIKTHKVLDGMDGFAETMHERYKRPADSPYPQMTPHDKGMQMGLVSNLITDMTLKGAKEPELARAVKHSMVIIDAEKHDLDWRQSAEDNNIRQLYIKYQNRSQGGASTLISKASSEKDINYRKAGELRIDPETGKSRVFYTDPKTGAKLWTTPKPGDKGYKEVSKPLMRDVKGPDGKVLIDEKTKQKIKEPILDENGRVQYKKVPKMVKSQWMYEESDAMNLSSGTKMEAVYGEYANAMKALANQARLEASRIKPQKQDINAKQVYFKEIKELDAALALAKENAPRERKAQMLANKLFQMKKEDNPELAYDKDKIKKVKGQCLEEARYRVGAKKNLIDPTDRQWEAIQAGAISSNKLEEILKNCDIDKIKKRATPRSPKGLPAAKIATAKLRLNRGYSPDEVAMSLGVSISTLYRALDMDGDGKKD